MKYVSIDIETTGLNPEIDQVLEIAAVIEDTEHSHIPVEELPATVLPVQHERVQGSPFAMHMNAELLYHISQGVGYRADQIRDYLDDFLRDNGWKWSAMSPIIAAGKNFAAFDLQFLRRLPGDWWFHHRFLDPMAYFIRWDSDTVPPPTNVCMLRAGFKENDLVYHRALNDARYVISLMRAGTENYTK